MNQNQIQTTALLSSEEQAQYELELQRVAHKADTLPHGTDCHGAKLLVLLERARLHRKFKHYREAASDAQFAEYVAGYIYDKDASPQSAKRLDEAIVLYQECLAEARTIMF